MGEKTIVCLTVVFGGWWACEEGGWVFKGSRSQKALLVDERIDYVALKKLVMEKFNVDGRRHEVEFTYGKLKKGGCRPYAIGDEEDLQAFKFVNGLTGERSWPVDLHVSLRTKLCGSTVAPTQGSSTGGSGGWGISVAGGEEFILPLTGPPVTQEDHAHTGIQLAGGEEDAVLVAGCVQAKQTGVQLEAQCVQLENECVQLHNSPDAYGRHEELEFELRKKAKKAEEIRRGKQVISVSSDPEDEVIPPGGDGRVPIDIGSSSDDDEVLPNAVKMELGCAVPTKSWSWDTEAEQAVREIEEGYARGKQKLGPNTEGVESEPMVAVNPLGPRQHTGELREGKVFRSKEKVQQTIKWAALSRCFTTKVNKSTKSLYVVRCGGPNCKWLCRVSTYKKTHIWIISKLVDKHTCDLTDMMTQKRRATYTQVGQHIVDSFVGSKKALVPEQVQALTKSQLGVPSSYWKARRAAMKARDTTYGTDEESYQRMYSYMHMLEQSNPGTYTRIERDTEGRFKYAFVSLGVWRRAVPYLRKVVSVDGGFLKGKFRGCLLFATAQDADHSVYRIAFAMVDGENDGSWGFFFRQMLHVVEDTTDLMWVSDRHVSIEKGIRDIYVFAKNDICTWNLWQNVRFRFKISAMKDQYFSMVKVYTYDKFQSLYNDFCAVSPAAGQYLREAGFEKWARACYPGNRYNITTTNNSECLNSVFKYPRDLPLTALMDAILETVGDWFVKRREITSKPGKVVSDWVAKAIKANFAESLSMLARPLSPHEFEVRKGQSTWLVNLTGRLCSCRRFNVDQYPCAHALAAAQLRGVDVHSLVNDFYKGEAWRACYADVLYPVPSPDTWRVPPEIAKETCLPPSVKARPGRPKTRRYPSQWERRYKRRTN